MQGRQAYEQALERLRARVRRPDDEARQTLIDRAVGLLAGRVGCRLGEAEAHLRGLAENQGREAYEVATSVVELLEVSRRDVSTAVNALDEALRADQPYGREWSLPVVTDPAST